MTDLATDNQIAEPRSQAGRPFDPVKRDVILSAARSAFFERGFNAATIEDIAARASVSKVTIYKWFGDKETLFEAMVRSQSARMSQALNDAAADGANIEAQLNVFGAALLEFMFHPDHIALDRILAPELRQMPALGRRFYAAGPGQCRALLSAVVAEADSRGCISVDDPDFAAEMLLAMWKGFADVELKFGMATSCDPQMINKRVARGTRLFLRAYRNDSDDKGESR